MSFRVFEETEYYFAIEIIHRETTGLSTGMFRGVENEQSEAVTITCDGQRARVALLDESPSEE